jgi:hypothetical protein
MSSLCRANLSLGASVAPILSLQDQQGARHQHSVATKHRGPPQPNHANHQSHKSRARDLPLQLAAVRPQSRPYALASSPPTVFNSRHDARCTPHHEGCSTATPEERCHQTSNIATPAAWPRATSEDTTDLQEATHYDLLGADLRW